MFVSGAWEIPNLDEANAEYGIAKLPKGKQESVTLVTDSYVMSSISEHKDEAFKFIEFMINPEIQKTVTDAYNWFPVTKAEESRDRYKEENMKPLWKLFQMEFQNHTFLTGMNSIRASQLQFKKA